MLFLLLPGMYFGQADWDKFRTQIDGHITVTSSEHVFRTRVEDQLNNWVKGFTTDEDSGYEILESFHVKNSKLMFISAGKYLEPKAFFVARPVGKRYRIEAVEQVANADRFVPKFGVLDAGRIGATGIEHSGSNYGHPGAASYRFDGSAWKLSQWIDCSFEGVSSSFKKHNNQWVSQAEGRTYPLNMSTSHSAARVWMKRRFTFQTGRFLATHDYLISSPMNTLDLLLAPSHRNSLKSTRAYCVNNATAKTFRTVAQKLRKNEVWMIGDNGADNTTIYAAEPRLVFRFRQIDGKWKLSRVTRHIPKDLESFRY